MWLKSIYLKTLREYRTAILGWGLGLGFFMYVGLASFAIVASPESMEALQKLAPVMLWYNEPLEITAPPGYVTWRMGPLMLALGIWALLAGSRTLRGEEDQGRMDVLLSVPRSRQRVIMEKAAALFTALLLIGLIIGIATAVGAPTADADFSAGAALLFGLNAALTASVFGALALLISQFTRQRGAASGSTGLLMALCFIIDSTARTSGPEWLRYLSPISAYHDSKPLLASVGISWGAVLVQVALIVGFVALAAALFVRRDIGAPAFALPRRERVERTRKPLKIGGWSLRSVFLRSLRTATGSGRWWALGIAGFATWVVFIVKQLEETLVQFLENTPFFEQVSGMFGGTSAGIPATMMSVYLIFFVLVLSLFAVTQVNRWASDEEEGRLDLVLTTPQPRWQVILSNFASFALVLLGIALVVLVGMLTASSISGFNLDTGRLVEAIMSMVPVALIVGAVGYVLSGWLRTGPLTGLLSALVLGSFLVSFLGPLLEWPEAVLKLSIFHHYGSPLLLGADWGAMAVLLALSVFAVAGATYRFVTKDIAR